MDSFFRFIKKYYLNFWIRNGILVSLIAFFNILSNQMLPIKERDSALGIALSIIISYAIVVFHNHIFLRRFLFQKKFLLYFFLFLFYLAISIVLNAYVLTWLVDDPIDTNIPYMVSNILINTLLAAILYFLHFYFLKYMKMNEIEILNQQTEIEYLKEQVNPHFLLNSLNNLYSVALSNPKEVPNRIIELTDLLKYQIETSRKEYNSLEVEKEFIEKYISYSKWKLQNIVINITQIGELKNYKITPMLFLPLVENAIKYSNSNKNPIIFIHWEFSLNKFSFIISNQYKDNTNEFFSTKSGLRNLRKRLSLFHPDSKLQIEENGSDFKAMLSLWNLSIHA